MRQGAAEEVPRRGHLGDQWEWRNKEVKVLVWDTLVSCGVGDRGLPFGECNELTPGLREDDMFVIQDE